MGLRFHTLDLCRTQDASHPAGLSYFTRESLISFSRSLLKGPFSSSSSFFMGASRNIKNTEPHSTRTFGFPCTECWCMTSAMWKAFCHMAWLAKTSINASSTKLPESESRWRTCTVETSRVNTGEEYLCILIENHGAPKTYIFRGFYYKQPGF